MRPSVFPYPCSVSLAPFHVHAYFSFCDQPIWRSVLLLLPWRFCCRPACPRGSARGNTPLRRGEWRHRPFVSFTDKLFFSVDLLFGCHSVALFFFLFLFARAWGGQYFSPGCSFLFKTFLGVYFCIRAALGMPQRWILIGRLHICCCRSGLGRAVRLLCASFSSAVFYYFQAAFRDILGQRAAARGCL